ncbi:MAG: P-loop NTPase [Christensenellales bacterium]
MMDQAESLRRQMNVRKRKTTIVTITSGKGGVGKSSLALNLGIALNRRGNRVLIIDTDFGFSNIDVMLGVHSRYDLMDVIENRRKIGEIIEIGLEGVQFISGGSGVYELTKLDSNRLMHMVGSLLELENACDTIIFDTGAGFSDNSLRLINASHETILVTTPEPTAIVDAYALLKMVHEQGENPTVSLVLNKADDMREAESVMDGLIRIVEKNTNIQMRKLAVIPRDINMQHAIKKQVPILIGHPKCAASAQLNVLVQRFLSIPPAERRKFGLAVFLEKFIAKNDAVKE